MASNVMSDSYGDHNDNLQNNAIHNYNELTGPIADYNDESTSSFVTVLQSQLEEELDIMSDFNFDEIESIIEKYPSMPILQGFNDDHPRIDYIYQQDKLFDSSSSNNRSWTNEDDFYGTVNTLGQTAVENSYMTVPLTLEIESTSDSNVTSTNLEFLTDREIVDYINDNTNESQQGEIWKSTEPAVLSFEGVFSNINKDIVESTVSRTVALQDKAESNEKTTKTTKRITSKKSNLSDKSKPIFKRKIGRKNKTEFANDFINTKYTEVKHHNIAIGCLMQRFCSRCYKSIPKTRRRNINKECQDCGPPFIYKCLNCNKFSNLLYGIVYEHIKYMCKPPSTFYCDECNFETRRRQHIIRHLNVHIIK